MGPKIEQIKIKAIQGSKQNPRSGMITPESVADLMASMKEKGLLNAIVVREVPDRDDKYEVVAGHRRLEAARLLGWDDIKCSLYGFLSDEDAQQIAIIENIQREDLPPVDEAKAFLDLQKCEITVKEIALKTGKSESHINRRLALLNLTKQTLDLLATNRITLTGAQLLGRIGSEEERFQAEKALLTFLAKEKSVTFSDADMRKMIDEEVLRSLKNVAWDLADADLVPKAGSCNDCPKNTVNQNDLFSDIGAKDAKCNDGACFASKVSAHSKSVLAKAKKEGQKVLIGGEAEKALTGAHGFTKFEDTVYLSGIGQTACGKIVAKAAEKGKKIRVFVAVDPKTGKAHRLVASQDVYNGEEFFSNGKREGGDSEKRPPVSATRKAEIRREKIKRQAKIEGLGMIAEKVSAMAKTAAGIKKLLEMAAFNRVSHVKFIEESIVRTRRFGEEDKRELRKYFKTLTFEEKIALGFETESASPVANAFFDIKEIFSEFPALGLSVAECTKRAEKWLSDKEAAKASKFKPTSKKEMAKKVKDFKADVKRRKAAATK